MGSSSRRLLNQSTQVARALAAGATVVQEPLRKTSDDDLRGGVRDPFGTIWWLAAQ
jgi:uncharacterized glyoxalase superfamily protein PhnB